MDILGKEILERAVKTYGYKQLGKAKEELGELIEEIDDYSTKKEYNEIDEAGMCEEIADVLIMCIQLILLFNVKEKVRTYALLKLHKLQQKLERENF